MEVAETHAYGLIDSESPTGCDHFNPRWLKWILLWKTQRAVIVTIFKRAIFESKDAEVPHVYVVLERLGHEIFQVFAPHDCHVLFLEPCGSH